MPDGQHPTLPVLEGVRRELGARKPGGRGFRRIVLVLERQPWVPAIAINGLVALLAIAVFPNVEVTFLEELAPEDPASVLHVLWQVHVGFAAIAFAGLAIIFQLASEPIMTGRSVRSILFRHTFFMFALSYALVGSIQLGVVALWFDTASAVALEFVWVFAPTIAVVGIAYSRAARVFSQPGSARQLGKQALLERAFDSLHEDWALGEANQRLNAQAKWAPVSMGSSTEPGTAIAVAPRDGIVADVHLHRVRDARRQLSSIAATSMTEHQATESTPSSHQKSPKPTLKVLFRIGQEIRRGDPLFFVQGLDSVTEFQTLEPYLVSSIVWATERRKSLNLFKEEAAALRDNVVAAASRGSIGELRDGLDAYGYLLKEIHSETEQIEQQLGGNAESSQYLFARHRGIGREWDVLVRDLYDVASTIGRSPELRVWIDASIWLFALAREFVKQEAEPGVALSLDISEEFWRSLLDNPRCDKVRQAAFLLRLKEFAAVRAHADGSPSFYSGVEFSVARTFTLLAKTAIDLDDPKSANFSLQYYNEAGPYRHGNELTDLRPATALALYAWVLYCHDRRSCPDYRELRQYLATIIGSEYGLWRAARKVKQEEVEGVIDWNWWEVEVHAPSGGGFVQLGEYILYAVILLSASKPLIPPDNPDDEDSGLARRLTEVSKAYISNRSIRELDRRTDDEVRNSLARVENLVANHKEEQDAKVAAMPLDEERVDLFYKAFESKLIELEADRLISALPNVERPDEVGDPLLGLNSLYPKWFFAETHVYARPEDLAEELVAGLLRGEEDKVVAAVSGAGQHLRCSLEKVVEQLSLWWSDKDVHNMIVLTNSTQAMSVITGTSFDGQIAAPTQLGGIVRRIYDDRKPYVISFDATNAIRVVQAPASNRFPGDRTIGDDRAVLLGVRSLTEDDVAELSKGDESPDTAIRLRSSVIVRMLEKLDVTVAHRALTSVWDLPDDTW